MRTALIVCSGVLGGLVCTIILFIAFMTRDRRPALDRQLYVALNDGNTNYLQRYLLSGGDVNKSILPPRGQRIAAPLLYYAIRRSQPDVVDFLLTNGANPNQPDGRGDIPLMWAIGHVRVDVPEQIRTQIFQRLLAAGADPNMKARSDYAYTPLLYAAGLSNQSNSVGILLRAGASVNATNTIGQTALHLAASAHVARLLLDAGADPTLRTLYGETAAEGALRKTQQAPLWTGGFDLLNVLTNAAPTRKVPD
jgi:ankyrin repeat protein